MQPLKVVPIKIYLTNKITLYNENIRLTHMDL